MKIIILRHAKAVEPGTPGFSNDSERPLSGEGEQKMRLIALGIKRLDLDIDYILFSPYLRAKRTAEIAAKILDKRDRLQPSDKLAAGADPEDVIRELHQNYKSTDTLMLVGHEPFLSRLMSILLTGDTSLAMNLKKGGLALLTVGLLRHGKCACLEWFLTPQQLVDLGAAAK